MYIINQRQSHASLCALYYTSIVQANPQMWIQASRSPSQVWSSVGLGKEIWNGKTHWTKSWRTIMAKTSTLRNLSKTITWGWRRNVSRPCQVFSHWHGPEIPDGCLCQDSEWNYPCVLTGSRTKLSLPLFFSSLPLLSTQHPTTCATWDFCQPHKVRAKQ